MQEVQRKRRFLQLIFSGTVAVLNLNQGSKVKEVWDPTLLETKAHLEMWHLGTFIFAIHPLDTTKPHMQL